MTYQTGQSTLPIGVAVTAGGPVNVAAQNLGSSCLGYAASAPDYRVQFTNTVSSTLRFYFVPNDSAMDTTLIVNTATGAWLCSDDSNGTVHPQVDVTSPTSGQYDIWVGMFSDGGGAQGTLYITENVSFSTTNPAPAGGNGSLPPPPPPVPSETPVTIIAIPILEPTIDPILLQSAATLVANSGDAGANLGLAVDSAYSGGVATLPLQSAPMPYIAPLQVRNEVQVSSLGPNCNFGVGVQPAFRLFWAGGMPTLRLMIKDAAAPGGFPMLFGMAVRQPNGAYVCGDQNTGITIPNAPRGLYTVFAGSQSAEAQQAQLLVSTNATDTAQSFFQQSDFPIQANALGDVSNASGLDPVAVPGRSIYLNGALSPDPFAVTLRGYDQALGQSLRLDALGGDCITFETDSTASDARLQVDGSQALNLWFTTTDSSASPQAVMVVRSPSNTYTCLPANQRYALPQGVAGFYSVWIGSQIGHSIDATLYVAERDLFPLDYITEADYLYPFAQGAAG